MPRNRTPIETAAGGLISAIQKESGAKAGRLESSASEEVMHKSHRLLHAAVKRCSIASALGASNVTQFLGEQWVEAYPNVLPYIEALEALEFGASDA